MAEVLELPSDWTQVEKWAWKQIRAGELADFNEKEKLAEPLDPKTENGWTDAHRLSAGFLRSILTEKRFLDAMPATGVRILGALVDDAPIDLKYARLPCPFWLERSRIMTGIHARNLRVDGEFSLEASSVAGEVQLWSAKIAEGMYLSLGAFFGGPVSLARTEIGSNLEMDGSTFEGPVNLYGAKVTRSAFLRKAVFQDKLDLTVAEIGPALVMDGSTFEGPVTLNGAEVTGSAFLRKAVFKDKLDLTVAEIGSALVMDGSTFEGPVNLNGAEVTGSAFLRGGAVIKDELDLGSVEIGSNLEMDGSTFEGSVNLYGAKVTRSAFLRKAVFQDELNLVSAQIGSNLEMDGSTFEGPVNLYGAKVTRSAFLRKAVFQDELNLGSVEIGLSLVMDGSTFEGPVTLDCTKVRGNANLRDEAVFKKNLDLAGAEIGLNLNLSGACFSSAVSLMNARISGELHLGSQGRAPAKWTDGSLLLRNCHCASLQDCWPTNENPAPASWPQKIELEGFTYKQLGGYFGGGDGPWNMRKRPSDAYAAWLERDTHYSPQPYRQLARVLHESGEPTKANDILFAARQRQRSAARDGTLKGWLTWFGLSLLRWTIGYGLGLRYFLVLGWVISFTLLGAGLLEFYGKQDEKNFVQLSFASFDQLLPLITLDSAHADLFSNTGIATPEAPPKAPDPQAGTKWATPKLVQPDWLVAYFYGHKMVGWLLGLFLVAGVAGLTQRN